MTTLFTRLIASMQTQGAGAPSLDAKPTLINSAPAGAAEGAAGAAPATGPTVPPPGAGGSQTMMFVLLGLFGVLIVFTMMNSNRDKKKKANMLNSIKKHDKVLTIGGIVGSVVEMKDDTIVLKVDEQTNTRITISKTAVSQVLASGAAD